MDLNMTLDGIRNGETSATEASEMLRKILPNISAKDVLTLYAALRAWTWKAINTRRRDADIRHWYVVLNRVSAALVPRYPHVAERIDVLQELIDESIAVSRMFPAETVLQKRHVPDLLKLLDRSSEMRVNRGDLGAQLGLNQANLSRVLRLASLAGFIERIQIGRDASFQLTVSGIRAAATLPNLKGKPNNILPEGIGTGNRSIGANEDLSIERREAFIFLDGIKARLMARKTVRSKTPEASPSVPPELTKRPQERRFHLLRLQSGTHSGAVRGKSIRGKSIKVMPGARANSGMSHAS